MSKFGIISAVVLSMSVSTASAQIVWNADQWDAYSPANRFAQSQTEVSDNQLVITPNWSEGKMATALHNNTPMVYAPSQSMIIFKVKTEGILFSDLKGAQVEIAHAYKADAPEGAPNFYTDKVNCTKTTKNGEGDNVGYFYVDMSDNLAKKGVELTENLTLNGNTNWVNDERSWIAFMIEANQLPEIQDYKINVLGLCSADAEQFRKTDGSLSAGMIRDYINTHISGVTTSISDVMVDYGIDLVVNGNNISCSNANMLYAYNVTGALIEESNCGQLELVPGIYIIRALSETGDRTFKVAIK